MFESPGRSYPIESKQLALALDKLFLNTAQPVPLSIDCMNKPQSSIKERIQVLAKKIENYILQMAEEADEYNDDQERYRLQREACGMLIILHDLSQDFPDVWEAE